VGVTEAGGDLLLDARKVAAAEILGDAEEDKQREALGLTLALDDGAPVAVAHLVAETVTLLVGEPLGLPLADAHTVAQALAEAERVAEAHTVNDPEAHGEPEEDRQRDAVGLTLELRE
jgi:hypothetical protein